MLKTNKPLVYVTREEAAGYLLQFEKSDSGSLNLTEADEEAPADSPILPEKTSLEIITASIGKKEKIKGAVFYRVTFKHPANGQKTFAWVAKDHLSMR